MDFNSRGKRAVDALQTETLLIDRTKVFLEEWVVRSLRTSIFQGTVIDKGALHAVAAYVVEIAVGVSLHRNNVLKYQQITKSAVERYEALCARCGQPVKLFVDYRHEVFN